MSSGLSGSCQTALMLAEDYEGRVQVVEQPEDFCYPETVCPGRQGFGRAGWSGEQIKEKLETTRFDSSIYITVDTLKYLKKGGQDYTCCGSAGDIAQNKAGAHHPGRKAGCVCKGKDHEAGQDHHADCPGP